MDATLKNELMARLVKSGHDGLDISPKRWRQLEAIDAATKVMIRERGEARSSMKRNELTVANLERKLKELGGVTITDQTMRNNGGMLERFFRTYDDDDVTIADLKRENKTLRERVKLLENRLSLMHERDADCEDALLQVEKLAQENDVLREDKTDLETQLFKLQNGKKSRTVAMTQIDLTKSAAQNAS